MATRAQIMSLAAARRGARFLDKRYGSKRQWRRLIKRRELRLESVCNCVLGQLEGDYNRGRERYHPGGTVMATSVRIIANEELLAALLRDAVEEFEDSSQGQGARDRFRDAVMGVADRLSPPVRLVADPLPQSGARRLLTAMESLEDVIHDGYPESRRV